MKVVKYTHNKNVSMYQNKQNEPIYTCPWVKQPITIVSHAYWVAFEKQVVVDLHIPVEDHCIPLEVAPVAVQTIVVVAHHRQVALPHIVALVAAALSYIPLAALQEEVDPVDNHPYLEEEDQA